MACINDIPNCGEANVSATPESLWEVVKWIVTIFGIGGTILSVIKGIGAMKVVGETIVIGGTAITSGLFAGAAVGTLAAVATLIVVILSARDRCNSSDAEEQCIAGVVTALVPSFSNARDELFPWQAMHDRVDVLVKSTYWQVVELGNAFVFCTEEERPRRSEILRCYFYEQRVCSAAIGAAAGAAVGAVAGIVAAALIAAALCTTVVLCLLGLILAVIVAVAAVLGGAAVGGQIAKAAAENEDPSADTGETISVGYLVTVRGPMEPRGYDENANAVYWVTQAQFHGSSMSPQPFSYCEVDDEFEDGCRRVPIVE